MAFIDFKEDALQVLTPSAPAPALSRIGDALVQKTYDLSELERRVIELARTDGLVSLRPRRKRSWLAQLILGPQAPSPVLANERLEGLRRLAVQVWHHGYQVPVSVLKEANASGWSEAQIGAVIDAIGRLRAPFRRLAA